MCALGESGTRTVGPKLALKDAAEAKVVGARLAGHRPGVKSNVAVAVVRPLLHRPLRLIRVDVLLDLLGDDVPLASKSQRRAAGEALVADSVAVERRVADG